MSWLRKLLLGNWRNKGVALFFAVMIWYVTYQSEKNEFLPMLRVAVQSGDAEHIVKNVFVDTKSKGAGEQEFDGSVRVTFSGPRKEIDKLRDAFFHPFDMYVSPDKTSFAFRQEDFGFPRDGVEIRKFEPRALIVDQEPLGTVTIPNVSEKINVTNYPDGHEVALREVIPGSTEIRLTGPKSIVSRLGVVINVTMGFLRDRYEGETDVTLMYPDDVSEDIARRTVTVNPPRVRVLVTVRAGMEALPVEAIRVTFRVPPVKTPIKIILEEEEVVGDTIPVEFYGRKDDMERLRQDLRNQPGFSLGVLVPPFDKEQGGEFTFTEDSMELYGFPGVQIRQHESRRKAKKGAWRYRVVPVKEGE